MYNYISYMQLRNPHVTHTHSTAIVHYATYSDATIVT